MNYIKVNRRFGILTISSVFLLLLAGGVVRSTGSGMGCPDWPKCYGNYFPPTCSCQLPFNYQEIYAAKRIQKARRFAKLLTSLGMQKQAEMIMNDPRLQEPEVFNSYKAWTEYVNRIIGVLSGFFSLIFFVSLIKIRKHISRSRLWVGIAGFIMMMFNAWLGSIVVATNLFPVIVTIHYLAAYAVLALFMISIFTDRLNEQNMPLMRYKWFFVLFGLVSIVQVILGTLLRQEVDNLAYAGKLSSIERVDPALLSTIFSGHWLIAIALVLISFLPVMMLRKRLDAKWKRVLWAMPIVMVLQYISGVLNLRLVFPMYTQVSHIFFAGLIFGITLYICIPIFRSKKTASF